MAAGWDMFSRDYPMLRAWIDERYVEAQRSTFAGNKDVIVFVARSLRTVRTHEPTGLPCFL
jgi:hypothetical protein